MAFQKGQKPTGKPFKKGQVSWMKGKHHSEEARRKISESRLGKKASEEAKKNMSKARLGKLNHFYGKKHTEESKQKNRNAHLGEKSSQWKGGISIGYLRQFATRPQSTECEVCGGGGKIVFDHDHKTGKFRGWICMRCNWVLGQVKDNGELLVMLKDYLNKS